MTKVDLVTGFLGAGKTTFITKYAKWLKEQGCTAAVIENEFGTSGTDSAVLVEQGFAVAELTGGCICCSLKVNFAETLVSLSKKFDRIIVEPSGIFAMEDFFQVMRSPAVKECCQLGCVLTVVDPMSLSDVTEEMAAVMASQLCNTGLVLFSKTEDLFAEQLVDAKEMIDEIFATVFPNRKKSLPHKFTSWQTLTTADFTEIAGSTPLWEEYRQPQINHETIFNSMTLQPSLAFSEETMYKKISQLFQNKECGGILRIKGRVPAKNGQILVVSASPSGTSVTPGNTGDAILTIIGKGLNRKRIREQLEI